MTKLPAWTLAAAAFIGTTSACSTLPASPVAATGAARASLDEKLGIGAEVAYTTATKLGTALAKAGLVDRAKFKALDNKAYSALLVTREAYKAGNAKSYADGVAAVQSIVTEIQKLVENNRVTG